MKVRIDVEISETTSQKVSVPQGSVLRESVTMPDYDSFKQLFSETHNATTRATSSSPPSPHSTVVQTSMTAMPSSSPSPHSTVVQPPMTTIPSGSSSPHSTVVQPSSHHSPSSTSGTSAKVARGREGEQNERHKKMEIRVFRKDPSNL
ncbi:hypothetical protein OUZ56_016795 [Daphnia magna]|uniref:Uncharacterized protein n=1 Tax=Daphnia magna TaxID=35525 RepID=A0ABR0AS07_9CRUS|nr:hypothetical protein OUZ56_016795 [Daphnia magna]